MFDWIQHIADRLVYDVLGMEAKTHLALQEALLQLYPDGIIDRTNTRIVSKPSPYLTDAPIYIYILQMVVINNRNRWRTKSCRTTII